MGKKITVFLLFLLILAILLNINWLKSPYIGIILSLCYLIFFGYLLGKIIFVNLEKSWQIIMGTFSLLALYSLLGAIIYYSYRLDQIIVSIIIVVISGFIIIINFKKLQTSDFNLRYLISKLRPSSFGLQTSSILIISYLILFIIALIILFSSQTSEAIKSPWHIIPKAFFILYSLASLNLFLILFRKTKTSIFSLLLIIFHFFLSLSVALIVYKLGFGYDPFVHQATELAIFKQGFILPKPFYYLGQYSLVITLAYMFRVSVELIDKLLLPILFSIFLPLTIYFTLSKLFNWPKNLIQILSLTFLFIPFSLFIVTTPAALASFFTVIILFLSLLYLKDRPGLGSHSAKPCQDRHIPFYYLIFLTLVTLAIHALSGIPILIYLIITWLIQSKKKIAKIILPILSLFAVFALPLALLINSLISIYKVQFEWSNFSLITWPTIFSKQFNYFLDLAYLYKNSIHWLILIIALLTLYTLIKHHLTYIFTPSLLTFLILIINAIFLNFIKVSFIIDYEQGEFSKRVLELAFYFLLPAVIYGFYLILAKISAKPFLYKSLLIITFSFTLMFSLYLSYPRFDDYDNSKFINVSQADFSAIKFIEKNANGQPYIVLSNQMTSAAALQTFGFSRYYNGQYFYPVPTGGELYKYFEQMIYQTPDKEVLAKAMDYTGVNISYFVLPTYWSRFTIITEEAKKYADAIYSLDDKIIIFKYFK